VTTSPVMHWLANGVPLTLLCDLASTQDPPSHAIYLDERADCAGAAAPAVAGPVAIAG